MAVALLLLSLQAPPPRRCSSPWCLPSGSSSSLRQGPVSPGASSANLRGDACAAFEASIEAPHAAPSLPRSPSANQRRPRLSALVCCPPSPPFALLRCSGCLAGLVGLLSLVSAYLVLPCLLAFARPSKCESEWLWPEGLGGCFAFSNTPFELARQTLVAHCFHLHASGSLGFPAMLLVPSHTTTSRCAHTTTGRGQRVQR